MTTYTAQSSLRVPSASVIAGRLPTITPVRAVVVFAVLATLGFAISNIQSSPAAKNASVVSPSAGKAYLSSAPAAAIAPAGPASAPMREIHIANNGFALVRGAEVLSVSGNTIRAHLTWGASDFTWTVHTSMNTKFFKSNGEKGSLNDIAIGDTIEMSGMLAGTGSDTSIDAQFVRE